MLFTSLEITKGTNKATQTNTYLCVCLRSFLWMCQDTNLSHRWLRGASPIPRGPELRQLQRSPDLSSESPSLCVCHALKPLEGFLPAINVTIFSRKINEPALTGQMTLSKISSSSSGIFPYLLSLCYALCFLKGCSGNLSVCVNTCRIFSSSSLMFAYSLRKWGLWNSSVDVGRNNLHCLRSNLSLVKI